MKVIAKVKNDYDTKFGIPRQSGLVNECESFIIMEPEYSVNEAFRGIEEYSHLWIIWKFSENEGKDWSPTVRPPKLGGNIREGVFATRSPFRPNPIGLSCVELKSITREEGRIVLKVKGADMMNGTPVLDIKPYIPYTDSKPEAKSGFSVSGDDPGSRLKVIIPDEIVGDMPEEKIIALKEILSLDPRPGYAGSNEKTYGFSYAGYEIKFAVNDDTLIVKEIYKQ